MSDFLVSLPMLLAMGLAGMLHCAGMCGGLAVLATGSRRAGRLAAYLAGKTCVYVLLGSLAGAAGEVLVRAAPASAGSRVLALAGGLLFLLAGLDSLGFIRLGESGLGWTVLSRQFTRLAGDGSAGALLIGAANGLLPCPMTFAFLALAAATRSAIWGGATLGVLGAVTAAPLALCGLLGYRLARWRRFPAKRVMGALLLVMAVLTVYRGLSLDFMLRQMPY